MAKKTGFDKFAEKMFEEPGVEIVSPVKGGVQRMTREERLRLARGEVQPVREETVGEGSVAPVKQEVKVEAAPAPVAEPEVEQAAQKGRGRPAMSPEMKQNLVPMHFAVDVEVKRKLERLKLDTYRSSVKDLLMEAIRDLFVKYNVE